MCYVHSMPYGHGITHPTFDKPLGVQGDMHDGVNNVDLLISLNLVNTPSFKLFSAPDMICLSEVTDAINANQIFTTKQVISNIT